METVQQNGRFTLFSSKFHSIYSIFYVWKCAYDRIVYLNIVKKRFFEKGETMLPGGAPTIFFALTSEKSAPPPYTNAFIRPCGLCIQTKKQKTLKILKK